MASAHQKKKKAASRPITAWAVSLGQQIERLRKVRKLTQEDLAALATTVRREQFADAGRQIPNAKSRHKESAMRAGTLSQIENGSANAQIVTLESVVRALRAQMHVRITELSAEGVQTNVPFEDELSLHSDRENHTMTWHRKIIDGFAEGILHPEEGNKSLDALIDLAHAEYKLRRSLPEGGSGDPSG